jgi:small-conductance mechanosensitive channel
VQTRAAPLVTEAEARLKPLKMQDPDQFGDYGIQVRCKMTTQPGEQFVVRRRAFPRIKQAFDENGI